jgi:hypothetical protein
MPYDTHDTAVLVRINRIILGVNKAHPGMTVAEKLEQAWSQNIAEREQDSTNTIGRDADYYFAARKELAASGSWGVKAGKAALGNVAWVVYGGLKLGTEAIGFPELMRTDKDKPNAPVGGLAWMNRGSSDGMDDVGHRVSDVRLHVAESEQPTLGGGPKEPSPSGMRRGTT